MLTYCLNSKKKLSFKKTYTFVNLKPLHVKESCYS